MSRFEWKLLAKWTLPSLLGERRERRDPARSTFRPKVDALEGRALLSHIAVAAIKHPVATPTTITQQTGGNGSNGSGGGGGVSLDIAGAGLLTMNNGHNLLNGATLSGPLPVQHVFNSHGKVIGVRPILPFVTVGQQTGGNGSVNVTTGAGGSGGGGGVSILFAPELTSLPKFGYIHGKLYKIFPPLTNTSAITVVQKTGGDGVNGGGGGGGVSVLIPFQVTLQTVRVKNVMAVKIVVATPPAGGTASVTTISQQTGGNGSNGGGGGGGVGIFL